jgi:tetratricopeptide (TPR) repeat protein
VPLKIVYVRYYEKNAQDWDYGIFFGRFLDREELQNGYFPAKFSIHDVTADGVTLCTVLKNDPQRFGFKGTQAMRAGDVTNSVRYMQEATKKDPYDVELWQNLTRIYMATGNLPAAKEAIGYARAITTLDAEVAYLAGDVALGMGDASAAQQIFGDLLESSPKQGEGYLGMAKIQVAQGSLDLAIQNVQTGLEYSPYLQREGFMILSMVFQKKGDVAQAQKFMEMAKGGGR